MGFLDELVIIHLLLDESGSSYMPLGYDYDYDMGNPGSVSYEAEQERFARERWAMGDQQWSIIVMV